jgi:hypothetical protein
MLPTGLLIPNGPSSSKCLALPLEWKRLLRDRSYNAITWWASGARDEFLLQFGRGTPVCHHVTTCVRQHLVSIAVCEQLQTSFTPEVIVVSGENYKDVGGFGRVDDSWRTW